jgi:hypothetical protein
MEFVVKGKGIIKKSVFKVESIIGQVIKVIKSNSLDLLIIRAR